jgi:hypothetical protein
MGNEGRSRRAERESAPTWARPPEPARMTCRGFETAAPSILQDERGRVGPLVSLGADRDDGPIAQGRHSEGRKCDV